VATFAVTGGSGFIGRYLVAELAQLGGNTVKVLSRLRKPVAALYPSLPAVEVIKGDLTDKESLRHLLVQGSTVINLAYLSHAREAENVVACANLLAACRAAKISRLIHCSTAVVVGYAAGSVVTEDDICRPATAYGATKLKLERLVLHESKGCFDATIVRPAAVFGPGGENLKKLVQDLTTNSRSVNYLRSCLFGSRRMNLVHVANVVAAILFVANYPGKLDGEVFNISDSDDRLNNFADVERILMASMHVPQY